MSESIEEKPSSISNLQEVELACPECHSGMIHLRYITYFTWLHQELVSVPNFPAWVCDVCGRREYDERAVRWLNILLNPSAGKRSRLRRANPHTAQTDQPHP